MKINAMLIGVQKGGTSSLYNWISQHPSICAPEILKDYHYFTSSKLHEIGWSFIDQQFEGCTAPIRMKGAVNYIFNPIAAPEIHAYNPACKLVLILRNPVKRALSAHAYFYKLGVEYTDFTNALHREKNTDFQTEDDQANFTYTAHGQYTPQIERYLQYFPKTQIHILFFEDLMQNKELELKKIWRFLEVDESFVPEFHHVNETGRAKFRWINSLLFGHNVLAKTISFMSKKIPLGLKIKFGNWIREINRTKKPSSKGNTLHVNLKELEQDYVDDVKKLSALLEIDLLAKWFG